jgi:hypothetical protein
MVDTVAYNQQQDIKGQMFLSSGNASKVRKGKKINSPSDFNTSFFESMGELLVSAKLVETVGATAADIMRYDRVAIP